MIDLSFLTDEEQESILKVLQRDADLKKIEEERIRNLPEKVKNDAQVKNMSGQWFYEAKSKRHKEKIQGADIIRASIRRKPLTIAELSQSKLGNAKSSWVNNVNKEIFVSPEQLGVIQDKEDESKSNHSPKMSNTLQKPQEGTRKPALSPSKQRKNPFNDSSGPEDNAKTEYSENGMVNSSETTEEENQRRANLPNYSRAEASAQPSVEFRQTGKLPVPKARKNVHKTSDANLQNKDSLSKASKRIKQVNSQGRPPKSILKRSSSSSSTDSEVLRLSQTLEPSNKSGLPTSTILEDVAEKSCPSGEDYSQNSLDRLKQVRFSSSVSKNERPPNLELHEGKELGEFNLLDTNSTKAGENEVNYLDSPSFPAKPARSYSPALDGNVKDGQESRDGKTRSGSYSLNDSNLPSLVKSPPAEAALPGEPSRQMGPSTMDNETLPSVTQPKTKQLNPEPCDATQGSTGQELRLAEAEEAELSNTGCADLKQGSEEELNPVMKALKRNSNRQIPSKSVEDIPSATSNKEKINLAREDLVLSAEDDHPIELRDNAAGISTAPSFSDSQFSRPEKIKMMSKSVPAFLQDESDDRETDTASESSYLHGRITKSPSSLTNLSGSSGLASLSSVSTSVMSVYSGDFGNVDVKGNLQFAIDYVEQLKEFHIFIAQGKDLAIADMKRQRSDPYVKSYLLPEKHKLGKRKTSVKKKTLNPVYNEILRYKIDKAILESQSLNVSVWHHDTFGRNSFLGEVELDLANWDWSDNQNKQMIWYPLKPRTPLKGLDLENRGEIKIALQYVPQPVGGKKTSATGEVHIWVKQCNDLPMLRGPKLNSFVKCTVLPDTSRKSRQKTRAVAKTTDPIFNHTMVYDGFRPKDLKEACVELTVWDHNKLANHFLGGLRIGLGTGKSYGVPVDWMDSTLDEANLWERMINSPNTWVEDTLPLRMLMVAKMTK
ncbi:synaptotagmin-like protein 2 isoform X7 [Crotalus tigris]|uniref:synaptotagmin-like protein 2 isoform X7 n=1 Tax=Crotalus tigris TaxID=88082 RepID=UPI00192F7FEB|nr:synaptotagmin-like protein 2 isoform X7 [Crotalus tigris]